MEEERPLSDGYASVDPSPVANQPVNDNLPSPTIPWGWLRALIFLVASLAVMIGTGIFIALVLGHNLGDNSAGSLEDPMTLLSYFLLVGTMMGLIWFFRYVIDRRPLVSLGFSLRAPFGRDLLVGLAWGVGLLALTFAILYVLGAVTVVGTDFPTRTILMGIPTLFLAAAMEEIMYRGYLQHNLMQSMNKWLAIGIVAALFSLMHGANPNVSWAGLVNIVLAGLLLGVYYMHRQNLWFPIGLHFTWNYFQGPVFGSPVSGIELHSILKLEFQGNELISGGNFGFEASLIASLVILLTAIAHHYIYRPSKEPESSAS